MLEAYCLTVREAAEVVGVELENVIKMIFEEEGIGLRVGSSYRLA